jgi:hypothetical protein
MLKIPVVLLPLLLQTRARSAVLPKLLDSIATAICCLRLAALPWQLVLFRYTVSYVTAMAVNLHIETTCRRQFLKRLVVNTRGRRSSGRVIAVSGKAKKEL